MTLLPVAPWPVLLVLGVTALVAVWWHPPREASTGRSAPTRTRLWALTAAVLLLFVASLRPGLRGDDVEVTAANLNVYFLVDTTSSMVAEDHGAGVPRLDGVRADVSAVAAALPGARYSIVTFDESTRVRLPLTTDTTALAAAVDTVLAEPPEYSRGSSVTQPDTRLRSLLGQAASRQPERGRIVFYLGDGEHTAATPPAPFSVPDGLIQGGAVLGYGTDEGGRMKTTLSRYGGGEEYLLDPTTGEEALSRIDESMLAQIGEQMDLPYVHRAAGDDVAEIVTRIDLDRFGRDESLERQRVAGRVELYWPLLAAVAVIAAVVLGAAGADLSTLGRGWVRRRGREEER